MAPRARCRGGDERRPFAARGRGNSGGVLLVHSGQRGRQRDVECRVAEPQRAGEHDVQPRLAAACRYSFEAAPRHAGEQRRHVAQPIEPQPAVPRPVAGQIEKLVVFAQGSEPRGTDVHHDAPRPEIFEPLGEIVRVVAYTRMQLHLGAAADEGTVRGDPPVPAIPGRGLREPRRQLPAAGQQGLRGGSIRPRRHQEVDVQRVADQGMSVNPLTERQPLEHQTRNGARGEPVGRALQGAELPPAAAHRPIAQRPQRRFDAGGGQQVGPGPQPA